MQLFDMNLLDELMHTVSILSSPFSVVPFHNFVVLPGFADVHVHLREPGFSYKETVESGTMAAAKGGYTAVCSMPNLSPVPDSLSHLKQETSLIEAGANVSVYPYGSITVGQMGEALSDMEALAPLVAGFSDDGRGVQDGAMMEAAMRKAKALGKLIVAHCEVNSLLHGGYIHDGAYAKAHGHRGISSASEYEQIKRDIALLRKTGASEHICHVSTKESVAAIRAAKAEGLNITAETAPHYLVLDENDLEEDGRFKMNPPLRAKEDREALLLGIKDGTIDMIATDHAPHSAEEKSRGLEKSAMGVVGLETAFPVLYTELVRTGFLSLEELMVLMSKNPHERFSLSLDGFSVWDLNACYEINPNEFCSKGRATPFAGRQVYGRCVLTVYKGKPIV